MGARRWLIVPFAALALTASCSGDIGPGDAFAGPNADPAPADDPNVEPRPNDPPPNDPGPSPDPDPEPNLDPNGSGNGSGGGGGSGGGSGGGDGSGTPCQSGPLPTPIPNCEPAPPPSTGDLHADCFARINQFRWECQCLPPLERWVDGEPCTDSNAEYDSTNGVHASFSAMPCGDGARAQNECPSWPSNDHVITGCLQAMWDEGPEDGNPNTVNGHYESMASTTYTRVACGFFTTPDGQVWGVQNFD